MDTLLVVITTYLMAMAYVLTAYVLLSATVFKNVNSSQSEKLGIAIVIGVILLAIVNNYSSFAIGALWTKVLLLVIPLLCLALLIKNKSKNSFRNIICFDWLHGASAAIIAPLFILAIAGRLFFWESISEGIFYLDLSWHISRVVHQAFQVVPGTWPLSPMAFPDHFPYQSFVADSLISSVLRYLPMEIYPYHYSQVLFCWSTVLWIAVLLVAKPKVSGSLILLGVALLLVPFMRGGIDGILGGIYVKFHANPNSLIFTPIILLTILYFYRTYIEKRTPNIWFIVLVPPSIIFIKANLAPVFLLLQLLGLLVWVKSVRTNESKLSCIKSLSKWAIACCVLWIFMLLMAFSMGKQPISTEIDPSFSNFQYYGKYSAYGSVGKGLDKWTTVQFMADSLRFYWLFIGILVGTFVIRMLLTRIVKKTKYVLKSVFHEVIVPAAVVAIAWVYVLIGWYIIVPTPQAGGGEPLSSNIGIFSFLVIVFIFVAIRNTWNDIIDCITPRNVRNGSLALLSACIVFVGMGMEKFNPKFWAPERIWLLRRHARNLLSLVPALIILSILNMTALSWSPDPELTWQIDKDKTIERVSNIRSDLEVEIPNGHCFSTYKDYAIYVGTGKGKSNPDFIGAATGCPLVNGKRWRGHFGNNNPDDFVRGKQATVLSQGVTYKIIHYDKEMRTPND